MRPWRADRVTLSTKNGTLPGMLSGIGRSTNANGENHGVTIAEECAEIDVRTGGRSADRRGFHDPRSM